MLKIKEEIGDLYETDPTAVWRSVEDIQRKYDIMTYVRSSQMSETSHLLEWCFPANTNRFDFCSAFVHVEEDDKVSRISTSSKQEFSVTVCQEDKRNFWEHDPSKSKYDYAFVRLYIAKIVGKILDVEQLNQLPKANTSNIDYKASATGDEKTLSLNILAEKAKYIIVAVCEWKKHYESWNRIRMRFNFSNQTFKYSKLDLKKQEYISYLKQMVKCQMQCFEPEKYFERFSTLKIQNSLSRKDFIKYYLSKEDFKNQDNSNDFNSKLYDKIRNLDFVTYDALAMKIAFGIMTSFYFVFIQNQSQIREDLFGKVQIEEIFKNLENEIDEQIVSDYAIELYPGEERVFLFTEENLYRNFSPIFGQFGWIYKLDLRVSKWQPKEKSNQLERPFLFHQEMSLLDEEPLQTKKQIALSFEAASKQILVKGKQLIIEEDERISFYTYASSKGLYFLVENESETHTMKLILQIDSQKLQYGGFFSSFDDNSEGSSVIQKGRKFSFQIMKQETKILYWKAKGSQYFYKFDHIYELIQ